MIHDILLRTNIMRKVVSYVMYALQQSVQQIKPKTLNEEISKSQKRFNSFSVVIHSYGFCFHVTLKYTRSNS
jgi:hypothetical protein